MTADSDLFIILECVDSTNNYAMGQVHSGTARDGNAWFAMEQTNGKGRRGRLWETQKGQNILLSIVIDAHRLQVYRQFQLTAAVSLACYDFFGKYDNISTKIKWPNDLFWNDSKAGGILIENVIKGNIWQWAVIGIGININQTTFTMEKNQPVSLKLITGQTYNIIELGQQLYKSVLHKIGELMTKDFEDLLVEYNNVLYKRNEKVKLKKQNIVFETTITGVTRLGQLKTVDSMEHYFESNEVELVI